MMTNPNPNLKQLVLHAFLLSQALICLSLSQSQPSNVFGPQNAVRPFVADNATKETYREFIRSMRKELCPEDHPSGIKVLRDNSTFLTTKRERFFEVKLTAKDKSIFLGIDKTNVYVVAYKVGQISCFFKDDQNPDYVQMVKESLFAGSRKTDLMFGGSYLELNRTGVQLGFIQLENAIRGIRHCVDSRSLRKKLVVIIQMVSEAVRYKTIEHFIAKSIRETGYGAFCPCPKMLELENKWKVLSSKVQKSTHGLINPGVSITALDGKTTTITRVDQISSQLGVMIYECTSPSSTLMSITTLKGVSNYLQMVTLKTICPREDVTAHIIGKDGMCVGTKNRKNDDGTPLQLQHCAQHDSQKWTLRRDKTIQSSQGKCIIASGFTPGQQAQLFNCTTAAKDAKLWNIWRDGTIGSANRQVVLTAAESGEEINLTVQPDGKTTYQGWQPNTNLEPSNVSIISYDDQCLQASRSTVGIKNCRTFQNIQRWAMYGDGSIRENSKRIRCLNSNGQKPNSLVGLRQCSGSANQRWVINGTGSIQNLISGLVMEVKTFNEIVLSTFDSSKPTQKWLVIL